MTRQQEIRVAEAIAPHLLHQMGGDRFKLIALPLNNVFPFKCNLMSNLLERITVNPKQCGGRPCIRGMRIRVSDVLDLLAVGLSAEQVLEEMPDLEMDDLRATLLYAARKLDHPVLVA